MLAILDKLADTGILSLTITGGEPFIRSDILEIIGYSIQKEFWTMNILSNGALLNNRHIDFITEHRNYIADIQFTVFSRHASIHDHYTGVDGGLSRILDTAEKLKKGGVNIRFAFSIFDFNLAEIKETYAFFAGLGFEFRIGVTKLPAGCSLPDALQTTGEKASQTSCSFYETFLNCAPVQFHTYEKKRFFDPSEDTTPINETLLCTGIQKNICIDSNGDLRPCSSFRNLVVGNIFENRPLNEILVQSAVLQKIKKMRRSDIHPCNACRHNKSCSICLGLIHSETGQLERVSAQLCNYANAIEHCLKR